MTHYLLSIMGLVYGIVGVLLLYKANNVMRAIIVILGENDPDEPNQGDNITVEEKHKYYGRSREGLTGLTIGFIFQLLANILIFIV